MDDEREQGIDGTETVRDRRLSTLDLQRLTRANAAYQEAVRGYEAAKGHAKRMVQGAREAMHKARGVAEYVGSEITAKYQVEPGDILNDDGTITRDAQG